jgi:hypothetical protein
MKPPVGKTVDRERVELVLGKKIACLVEQCLIGAQAIDGVVSQAQPESKPLIWRDARFDREGLLLDREEVIAPALSGMNV